MDPKRSAEWIGTGLLIPPQVDRNHWGSPWTASIKVMHWPLNPVNTDQYRGGPPSASIVQW